MSLRHVSPRFLELCDASMDGEDDEPIRAIVKEMPRDELESVLVEAINEFLTATYHRFEAERKLGTNDA